MGFPGGANPGIFRPVLLPPPCPLCFLDSELPSAAPVTLGRLSTMCRSTCACAQGMHLREGVCTRREVTVPDTRRRQGHGDALPPTPDALPPTRAKAAQPS